MLKEKKHKLLKRECNQENTEEKKELTLYFINKNCMNIIKD